MNSPISPLIELRDIYHSYGKVQSLNGVNIYIKKGEIHALVGEHGAGKSSLASIITGDIIPKSGQILFEGTPIYMHRSQNSLKHGIKMVYQTVMLNPYFTVAESLYYANHLANKSIWVSPKRMESAAFELFSRYNIHIKPEAKINSLHISELTVVEIFRCLQTSTSLLIIDEGLDNLSSEYYQIIISMLKEYLSNGLAVLFITHKIEDIHDVANRVSIMKNGKILITDDVKNIDKISLLRLTYTQINRGSDKREIIRNFNNLLKYNEAILRFLPVNLIVTDSQEMIELVNNNCSEYFDLQKEYYHMSLEEFLGNKNSDVLELIREAFLEKKEKNYYRVRMIASHGETMTNIKIMPIYDIGTVIGNIIIIEDISEFEKLQDKLILSEKLASVGLLAAGVAHEINNPLEIIYNYLAFLKYNISDEKLLNIIDIIQNELVAISGIVSNLVTFSSKSVPELEILNVDPLIEEIINLLEFNAENRNIHIRLFANAGQAKARLNRNEFKQVLLNIIKNSFEAMPEGGDINIFTSLQKTGDTSIIKIIVSDSGEGIPENQLQNIFLPFFSTKKGEESNLGLGLSISYSIVQKLHGTMSAQNNPEGGCSIIIEFPAILSYNNLQ
jgi:signal transduction histidine kinase/ABC-type branched-subunit amino acid transport system ATPase component